MKKVDCPMCLREKWSCAKHPFQSGKIHSGVGAIVDAMWDCPNCNGKGFLSLSVLDRFLLYFGRRIDMLRRTVDGKR